MFPYYILFLDADGVPYITGPWSETDIDAEFRIRAKTAVPGTLVILEVLQGEHATIPFVEVSAKAWRWTGDEGSNE